GVSVGGQRDVVLPGQWGAAAAAATAFVGWVGKITHSGRKVAPNLAGDFAHRCIWWARRIVHAYAHAASPRLRCDVPTLPASYKMKRERSAFLARSPMWPRT